MKDNLRVVMTEGQSYGEGCRGSKGNNNKIKYKSAKTMPRVAIGSTLGLPDTSSSLAHLITVSAR